MNFSLEAIDLDWQEEDSVIDWSQLTQQLDVIRKDHAHLAEAFDFETVIESYRRWIEALSEDVTPIELHAQIRRAKVRLLHEAKEAEDDHRWIPIESVHDALQDYIRISNKMMDVFLNCSQAIFRLPVISLGIGRDLADNRGGFNSMTTQTVKNAAHQGHLSVRSTPSVLRSQKRRLVHSPLVTPE